MIFTSDGTNVESFGSFKFIKLFGINSFGEICNFINEPSDSVAVSEDVISFGSVIEG